MSNKELWKNLISEIENMPQEEFDKLVEECDKKIWAWDLLAEGADTFRASLSVPYKSSDNSAHGNFKLNKINFFIKDDTISISPDKPFSQEFSIDTNIEAA